MADATRYLMAASPEEEIAVVEEATNQLKAGTLKLVGVVQSIGPYVTCDDLIQQAKAIQYLSAVLAELDPNFLMGHDIMLITKFLTSRLEIANVAGVRETVHGLRTLAKMSRFKSTEAVVITEVIFRNAFDFPSQVASTRLEVYRLLDDFITKYRQALRTLNGTFVDGLVDLSARETDPRNLMICFSILRIVIMDFGYNEEQTTSLWDAASKYFPITFRPKPNDPIGITADDLKLRLRSCISATSAFAPLAFPFLIQKLDDQTIANVKKDVMRTITACVTSYDPATVSLWSSQIWEALKYEVLNATDDDLAGEALETLSAVASRLSFEITLQTLEGTPLHRYITLIITDCNENFREPQQRYAKQSGQILARIAASSPLAFHLNIKDVLPLLQTIYQDADAIAKKRDLLEVINGLLDARLGLSQIKEFQDSSNNDDVASADLITSGGFQCFRDSLLEMFTVALTNTISQELSFRIAALQGLLRLVKIPQYLTTPEVGMVIQNLNQLVLDQQHPDDQLRLQAITALQQIASKHSQNIADITFPALLGTLPDQLAEADDGRAVLSTLEAFGKIASGGVLFEVFLRRLLNRLDIVLGSSTLRYAKMILVGLLFGVQQREHLKSQETLQTADGIGKSLENIDNELYRKTVESLYRKVVIVGTLDGKGSKQYIGLRSLRPESEIYADDDMLELIGKIAMISIRPMSLNDQLWAVPQIFKLFTDIGPQRGTDRSITRLADSEDDNDILVMRGSVEQSDANTQVVKPLLADLSVSILSMYLLAGLRREHALPFSAQELCIANAAALIRFPAASTIARFSMQNYVALLVNKHNATVPDLNSLDSLMPQDYITKLINTLLDGSRPVHIPDLQNRLQLIFTFTMASNLKGDRITAGILESLIKGLENQEVGSQFAAHFEKLLAPSAVVAESNHALIRRLSKQRLFGICVPKIVTLFKTSADTKIKSNCLVAIAGILKYTPSAIVLPHIENLLPLLLQTLKLKDLGRGGDSVKAASIDVLRIAITQSSAVAEGHIHSIIGALTMTWFNPREKSSTCSAGLRAKALQCMAAIPKPLRDIVTLPYKTSVLRDLEEGAVGDPKRLVRTEAVDCKSAWANLAEPVGDDD